MKIRAPIELADDNFVIAPGTVVVVDQDGVFRIDSEGRVTVMRCSFFGPSTKESKAIHAMLALNERNR